MNAIAPIAVRPSVGPTVRIHRGAAYGDVFALCAAILDLERRTLEPDVTELELHRLLNEQSQLIRVLSQMRRKLKTQAEAVAVARTALLLTDKDDLSDLIGRRLEGLYFRVAAFLAASEKRAIVATL